MATNTSARAEGRAPGATGIKGFAAAPPPLPETAPQADVFAVAEDGLLTGDLFADNGAGPDTDPDAPLSVAAVNGVAALVGTLITLPSGARLTVNADGTFSYDPNGGFNSLPGPLSGATNGFGLDSFTYSLAGGGTATVTINVAGVASDGDVMRGGAGAHSIVGGPGIDTMDYSAAAAGCVVGLNAFRASNDGDGGSDTLNGIENVIGSAFNDTVIGADNVNVLWGGDGRDYLIGLGGSDVMHGGFGAANHLQGGFGDDDYYVDALDTITEFANQGYDQVFTSRDRYNLAANLEELIYTGSSAFFGGGNARDNLIQGGAGDDYLNGRGGADILRGGDGMDVADYLFAIDDVIVSLVDGLATNDGDDGIDTLQSIEGVRGSNHNDLVTGDAGANLLDGAGGDDTLNGGDGADCLRGAAGEDILLGGAGADMIVGGDDDDFLSGGSGAANHLQGGRGDDVYVVAANDTLVEFANEGYDRVQTARAAYTLKAHLEELEFTGTGGFTGGGNDLNNRLIGGAGADALSGGRGNDTLDGRDGFDTAVLSGTQGQYAIVELASGAFRVTDSVGGRDGVDTLVGMEQIRFSDGTTLALVPALAPALGDKGADGPEVVPGLADEDFVLPAGAVFPDMLPADGQVFAGLQAEGGLDGGRVLFVRDDGFFAAPLGGISGGLDHDDWLY